jgi:hypothetical protein
MSSKSGGLNCTPCLTRFLSKAANNHQEPTTRIRDSDGALDSVEYEELSKEEFDAIVTGELTHYAIWLEDELVEIICDYFLGRSKKRADFGRLLLRRDGLTFQDKIEIVRGMLTLFGPSTNVASLRSLLNRVEEFKSFRNAFAHGLDVTTDSGLKIKIEIVTRSGREKLIEISPETHRTFMDQAETLFSELQEARQSLRKSLTKHPRATSSKHVTP